MLLLVAGKVVRQWYDLSGSLDTPDETEKMIFAELATESRILQATKDVRSVLIVACPVCANLSIAYEKNLPVYERRIDETTGESSFLPIAITSVATRLKTLLEERGISARIAMHRAPCLLAIDEELTDLFSEGVTSPELSGSGVGSDTILSLSCAVGTLGLRKRLGESAKVIPAMKNAGIGQFKVIFDERKTFVHVDKENSTIIPTVRPQNVTR